MIPYDELVVALQTWRARQGLPVAQLSGALTPPPVVAPPVVARPAATPPSGPARAAPPAPPGRPAPPPLVAHSEETIDEASLLDDAAIDEPLAAHIDESHYGNDGDNFSIPFDAAGAAALDPPTIEGDESTSISTPPLRASLDDMDATNPHGDPTLPRAAKRTDDW